MINYRETKAANYSTLSKLSVHPIDAYESLTRPEKQAVFFDIGNYVDEGFYGNPTDTHFVISDNAIPENGTKARAVADSVLNVTIGDPSIVESDPTLEYVIGKAAEELEYQPNWKPETRIAKLKDQIKAFVTLYTMAKAEGRSLITVSQMQLAETLIQMIKESKRFQDIIDGCEIQYQQPIYFTHNGVACKCLPDIILRNHLRNTIRVLDIKTYEARFMDNYYRFRYFYQGAFYSYGLTSIVNQDTRILNPVFVTADKSLRYPVRLFEQVDWKALWGTDGAYYLTRGGQYKTLPALLNEYKYHTETGDWSESYEAIVTGSEKITLR